MPERWFVLIEESGDTGHTPAVARTILVDGGADAAQAAALDVARSHARFPDPRGDRTREIYRISPGVFQVVLRTSYGSVRESFRVSAAELIEVHEPPAPAREKRAARRWHRNRG